MNITTQGIGHKVMSVLMALVLAIGLAPLVPAGNAWAVSDQDAWANGTIETSPEAVDGKYVVTSGDVLSVTGFTTGGNIQVDDKDYTVVYFGETDGVAGLSDDDKIVQSANTESDRAGDMPLAPATYYVVVIDNSTITSDYKAIDENTWADWKVGNAEGPTVYKAQEFTVEPVKVSIENAYAFQGTLYPTPEQLADRIFNYTGAELQIAFGVNDEAMTAVGVEWAASCPEVPSWNEADQCWNAKEAGTYTAKLTGMDRWTGTKEVSFEIVPATLSADTVAMLPQTVNSVTTHAYQGKVYLSDESIISINGEQMASAVEDLTGEIIAKDGAQVADPETAFASPLAEKGAYTVRLESRDATNIPGGPLNVTLDVVDRMVDYYYNGNLLSNGGSLGTFDMAKGTFFVPSAITASEGEADETTVSVYKNGELTTDYTQPGVYDVVVNTAVAADHSYAGHAEFTFTVAGKDYTGSKVYASWQGKNVAADDEFEYTGEAVDPTVVVKDAEGELLTEGTDYSVELRDAATGEAVESAVNVGGYQIAVTFNGTWNHSWTDAGITQTLPFEIVKANIVSGEPTEAWFALPADGSAATPDFTLVSDQKTEFPMSDVETSVVYTNEKGERVDADELTVAGTYTADINVLNTSDNFKGGAEVEFVVAETVAFADVDTNAWYADEVYQAAKNHYVQGMGNKLFFPEAQMTRAQFAQVLYNMAGETGEWGTHPTQFTDVTADAWYAEAVSWAVEAGVVKGTSETTFDPEGNITREQIATMLYRYAGNGAEADASALDAFVDGGEVCDWAETAMAWAVESGYMNGKGANDLQPHANATRAEVAALAVRVQPEPISDPDVTA